jgi:hypothetical protein
MQADRIREHKRLLSLSLAEELGGLGLPRSSHLQQKRREMQMAEMYLERVYSDNIVLNIGDDIGALIIYTREDLRERQIEVSSPGIDARKIHNVVHERRLNGRPVFAAVFPTLAAGDYKTWTNPTSEFTIAGGQVAELDWRDIPVEIHIPYAGLLLQRSSATTRDTLPDFLPPRYRNGKVVSAAPMGAASVRYSDDGQIAWNEIWTDFCDLALAGGPPHRDTLLEPVPPDEVKDSQEAYERVVAEIERGFQMVTGLPTVHSKKLGWVGLQCDDEEMALWLLRAIVVENVCVRREGNILYLPAGPGFSIEKEIKNVITVVAKTHHYWTEHCLAPY